MLQRLRVLQQATLTGRPVRLLPRLYLSGAVEASSMYLLRHLGITHVLNATEVSGAWVGVVGVGICLLGGGQAPCSCCDTWAPHTCSMPPRCVCLPAPGFAADELCRGVGDVLPLAPRSTITPSPRMRPFVSPTQPSRLPCCRTCCFQRRRRGL